MLKKTNRENKEKFIQVPKELQPQARLGKVIQQSFNSVTAPSHNPTWNLRQGRTELGMFHIKPRFYHHTILVQLPVK